MILKLHVEHQQRRLTTEFDWARQTKQRDGGFTLQSKDGEKIIFDTTEAKHLRDWLVK